MADLGWSESLYLLDDRGLFIVDDGVVAAQEGLHSTELSPQHWLTHPELRRDVADPADPGRKVVSVYEIVGDQGLAGHHQAGHHGCDVSGGQQAGEEDGSELGGEEEEHHVGQVGVERVEICDVRVVNPSEEVGRYCEGQEHPGTGRQTVEALGRNNS